MFVGHFGIAQLGKGARREIPFALLLIAAYLPDLVRVPLGMLTANDEILSHSIPVVLAMGVLAGVFWLLRGGQIGAAAVVALACWLHWPADVFTGCKPTTFDGPWIGFVNYRRPVNDLLLEGALVLVGWWLARRRGFSVGKRWLVIGFTAQILFLLSTYLNAEFIIGSREWVWHPAKSLVPSRQPLEKTPCSGPE